MTLWIPGDDFILILTNGLLKNFEVYCQASGIDWNEKLYEFPQKKFANLHDFDKHLVSNAYKKKV